jgi:hypothetical protein
MKLSVRTSFSSGRPRASAFTRGRGFTRGRSSASAQARVPVGADPRPRRRGADARAHDRADRFERPRRPVTARPRGRAWTRIARPRARADAVKRPRGPVAARTRGHGGGNLGETLSFPYKRGSSQYISPTSNQARLNSWGLKRCVYTSFFPDYIVGFLVGSPLQTGGEVLLFCRIF